MRRYFCHGVLFIMILLISVSCSSYFRGLKDHQVVPHERAKEGQALAAIVPSEIDFPELIFKGQLNPFIRFVDQNQHILLALAGLFWLWFLIRIYQIERGRTRQRLSIDDLALLKIIKDNATRIWHNHHPGKNIISLEDWKE